MRTPKITVTLFRTKNHVAVPVYQLSTSPLSLLFLSCSKMFLKSLDACSHKEKKCKDIPSPKMCVMSFVSTCFRLNSTSLTASMV